MIGTRIQLIGMRPISPRGNKLQIFKIVDYKWPREKILAQFWQRLNGYRRKHAQKLAKE
jgi:hypothetical protein